MTTVYLNGEFRPQAEAKVSVMDRGFLFGDGVYEVIPVYARQPFRLQEHLHRLKASLAAIRLDNPHSDAEWQQIIKTLVEAQASADQQVYLQVTRGLAPVRNHAFPPTTAPTVLVMSDPLQVPEAALVAAGVSAVSAVDFRWLRCDIKATSLLANCLLRQLAVDAGCAETVLFRDGVLTEGAASNIFVIKDKTLLAPRKSHLMLPGITYDVVLEIVSQHGIPCTVRDISEAEVRGADELLMTSSTREVLPIVALDGHPVADGKPGPLGQKLAAHYQEFKRTVMYGNA